MALQKEYNALRINRNIVECKDAIRGTMQGLTILY